MGNFLSVVGFCKQKIRGDAVGGCLQEERRWLFPNAT